MSISTHPAYHHGDLRKALLESARAILDEKGVAGLSLRDVARRAKVSHAAPKRHFPDKRGLLSAVAAEGFRELAASLAAAVARASKKGLSAPDRYVEMGTAYVRFGVKNVGVFRIMFRQELLDPSSAELRQAADELFEVVDAAAAQSAKEGWGPDADPMLLMVFGWAMAHGLTTLWTDGSLAERVPPRSTPTRLSREIGQLFLKSVQRAEKERPAGNAKKKRPSSRSVDAKR